MDPSYLEMENSKSHLFRDLKTWITAILMFKKLFNSYFEPEKLGQIYFKHEKVRHSYLET